MRRASIPEFVAAICIVFIATLSSVPTAIADSTLISRELNGSVMGTELRIQVFGTDDDSLQLALDAALKEIQRVEDLMTDWRSSPLMDLNDAAGKGAREVDRELVDILATAIRIGDLSSGAFDVSYASAGRYWDFKKKPAALPDSALVKDAIRYIDYTKIQVDTEAGTVLLPEHMRIGLGGIAKGYGVDRAMAVLMEHGIRNAVVDAGGDMKLLGRKAGELWEVAIKHPRDRDKAMAVLHLSNTCVVTSGDYERFIEVDGKRYHHIIDPRTGYPGTGCLSATVVGPSAEYADALATAMCILGPQEGLRLLEELPRTEGILVGMDGRVHVSTGLQGVVESSETRH